MLENVDKNWACQLWSQVYRTMYLQDHQGFRLTPEERDQLIIYNREFLITTTEEKGLFENLCWELPVEQWKYVSMNELAEKMGGMDPGQAGKRINRLLENDTRIMRKNFHGHKIKYLLPPIRDMIN